ECAAQATVLVRGRHPVRGAEGSVRRGCGAAPGRHAVRGRRPRRRRDRCRTLSGTGARPRRQPCASVPDDHRRSVLPPLRTHPVARAGRRSNLAAPPAIRELAAAALEEIQDGAPVMPGYIRVKAAIEVDATDVPSADDLESLAAAALA